PIVRFSFRTGMDPSDHTVVGAVPHLRQTKLGIGSLRALETAQVLDCAHLGSGHVLALRDDWVPRMAGTRTVYGASLGRPTVEWQEIDTDESNETASRVRAGVVTRTRGARRGTNRRQQCRYSAVAERRLAGEFRNLEIEP